MTKSVNKNKLSIVSTAIVASLVFSTRSAYLLTSEVGKVYATANTGAIWTTDVACGGVDLNTEYNSKQEVYLNGGPQGNGNNGLPDGNYYVMVTDPSGSNILGVTGSAVAQVVGGKFVVCYNLFDLTNFADTTNNGGEYKVWVSMDANFSGGTNKTDNFKVKISEPSESPSESPSSSPSESPSSSPSSSPSESPSSSPSSSPEESVSPSPSSSASVSPSPSPSNSNSDNSNSSSNTDSSSSNNEQEQEGEVLGEYAETGIIQDAIMNITGSIGGLLTAIGTALYGKKKNKKA